MNRNKQFYNKVFKNKKIYENNVAVKFHVLLLSLISVDIVVAYFFDELVLKLNMC
jgi:hypothetical protein